MYKESIVVHLLGMYYFPSGCSALLHGSAISIRGESEAFSACIVVVVVVVVAAHLGGVVSHHSNFLLSPLGRSLHRFSQAEAEAEAEAEAGTRSTY